MQLSQTRRRGLAGVELQKTLARDDAARQQCIDRVIQQFPFKGYMEPAWSGYDAVAKNCADLLPDGGQILDFGAGPCDKTAVLSQLGFQCTAIDDLGDDWHEIGDNQESIRRFAKSMGVRLIVANGIPGILEDESFDMVMAHDVVEHLRESPRELLLRLIHVLRTGGYLYLTVPNAVNLRKRLLVLSGRTNYPRYPAYFWSAGKWRGHIREYVKDDLRQLCHYLGLETILLKGQHHRLGALPRWSRPLYRHTLGRMDSLRETLALIARKPEGWRPCELTAGEYKQVLQRETSYNYVESRVASK